VDDKNLREIFQFVVRVCDETLKILEVKGKEAEKAESLKYQY